MELVRVSLTPAPIKNIWSCVPCQPCHINTTEEKFNPLLYLSQVLAYSQVPRVAPQKWGHFRHFIFVVILVFTHGRTDKTVAEKAGGGSKPPPLCLQGL